MEQGKNRNLRIKVFILHNIISPYRLPLFEHMSKLYDLFVYFCTTKTKDRLWETSIIKQYNFRWHILPRLKLGSFILNFSLPLEMAKRKYDVYIIGETVLTILSVILAILTGKLLRRRVIIWIEDIETEYSKKKKRERIVSRFLYNFVELYRRTFYPSIDAFVAYSRRTRKLLLDRYNIHAEKVHFGDQVMPKELLMPSSTRTSPKGLEDLLPNYPDITKKKVILYMGYLKEMKGVDILIKAYKQLNRGDTVLLIAGDGELKEYLQELAEGRDDIIFVGYVDGEKKMQIYSMADIFVLPTFHDVWGLVINEAMYFGLPIIVTSAAASSDIISRNGLIVPPGNERKLLEALNIMLENNKLKKKMRIYSKKYANKYTSVTWGIRPFNNAIYFVKNQLGDNYESVV